MKHILAPLLILLAGCAGGGAPDGGGSMTGADPSQQPIYSVMPPPGADTCDAAAQGNLIGKPGSLVVLSTLPPGSRIVRPGQVMTADFAPGRLNVDIGPGELVDRLFCD